MAWVTPKTDWTSDDYINASDYNRIKNNVDFLYGEVSTTGSTDYPNSIVVYHYSMSQTQTPQDFVLAGTTMDANVSIIHHTPINNGKIVGEYRLIQDDDNVIVLHFESDENGHYEETPTVIPRVVGIAVNAYQLQMASEYFEIEDMGSDKTTTGLPYAYEWNTIIDNLEIMCYAIGEPWLDAPFYSDNGYYPTAEELNRIEEIEQLVYNRINGIT